jgi:hypothetical protein
MQEHLKLEQNRQYLPLQILYAILDHGLLVDEQGQPAIKSIYSLKKKKMDPQIFAETKSCQRAMLVWSFHCLVMQTAYFV